MRLRNWLAAAGVLTAALGSIVVVQSTVQAAVTASSIQDTAQGTGVGQVQFSSGWNACTGNCGAATDNSFQWTSTVGSTATIRFTGNQIKLFGMKEPFAYIGTVAIDGNSPTDVDYYAATTTPATVQVYSSPVLSEGTHTLVLTMTGRKNPASTGGNSITFDRADVTSDTTTPPPTTSSVQDTAQGTGVGQVQFSSGWNACTGNCGAATDNSFQWTSTVGSTATIRFTGNQIKLFGMKEPFAYIGTVAIDGNSPTDVDYYAATTTPATVQVYSSPVLSEGTHTLVLTMTGRKNPASTGGNSITFDRADVTGGTTTPPSGSTRSSGLPWNSGVNPQPQSTERSDQFASFRGTPIDNVVLHPPRDNWNTISDPVWIADGLPTGFNPTRDDLVMSIPLWPSSNSVSNTGTQAQWQNLANVIKAKDPDAYIRLGWEMNLPSWYYHLNGSNRAAWQASFVQAVQWMKAVAPNLRIVWNPNKGGDQTSNCGNCSREVFQAVKAYVDVYGIDSYDAWPADNTPAARNEHLSILTESLNYAKANGKKFAVPEWGIACNTSGCQWQGNAGGDNPQYIHDYVGFFKANAADLAFEAYFDEPDSYIRSALSSAPIGPNAPAAYRADIQAAIVR